LLFLFLSLTMSYLSCSTEITLRFVPWEFVKVHHQSSASARRAQAWSVYSIPVDLVNPLRLDAGREGMDLCSCTTPGFHMCQQWLGTFLSPLERSLTAALLYIASRLGPSFIVKLGCLYESAFHSQFSLGQTRVGMHLKHNKIPFYKEKRLGSRPLAKLNPFSCYCHLQIMPHSLTIYLLLENGPNWPTMKVPCDFRQHFQWLLSSLCLAGKDLSQNCYHKPNLFCTMVRKRNEWLNSR
jgi:hypothetical protein